MLNLTPIISENLWNIFLVQSLQWSPSSTLGSHFQNSSSSSIAVSLSIPLIYLSLSVWIISFINIFSFCLYSILFLDLNIILSLLDWIQMLLYLWNVSVFHKSKLLVCVSIVWISIINNFVNCSRSFFNPIFLIFRKHVLYSILFI